MVVMAPISDHVALPNPRKRKRRRRQDKPAVASRLVLDDHIKGDVGLISEDLFKALFPFDDQLDESNAERPAASPDLRHLAISPRFPFTSVDDLSWTIVPIRPSTALANSTIQFSPTSQALQRFADELQRTTPSKLLHHSRTGIEIWAFDVQPLPLDTVFVSIEAELAKSLENGEGTFHGEHLQLNGYRVKGKGTTKPEDNLASSLREALGSLKVVHDGDFFPLPLPPHPITHVPPPPGKVTLCEPVAQGCLSSSTRIIVAQIHHHVKSSRKVENSSLNRALSQVNEADEDTANEQFYSAAEDRYKTDVPVEEDDSASETETETSAPENDDLSDDSMEDIISLQAPTLPASNASGMSTMQSATPHISGLGRKTNGISTPGSVFSSFTTMTARAGGQKGSLFKAQSLLRPMSPELLRPSPLISDDEEARVYVDVNSLTRIGCFSGDWIRVECAPEPIDNGMGLWSLKDFGNHEEEEGLWRSVKVFSLPEGYSRRPITKIGGNKNGRRPSFFESQVVKPSSPTVYLSPILWANLENSPYFRLSALRKAQQLGKPNSPRITSSTLPSPAAKVTFSKILTPSGTERNLQATALAGLTRYFRHQTRIIKSGDVIAIPIDEGLGRTLYQPSANKEDLVDEILSSQEQSSNNKFTRSTEVVWYKITQITASRSDGTISAEEEEAIWGGVTSVDLSLSQLSLAGSEKARLPGTMSSPWEYYLGLRAVSKIGSETPTLILPEFRSQHVTPLRRRLRELVAAATSPRAIHLKLPPLAILLSSTQRAIGKTTLAKRACSDIGLHSFIIDSYDIVSEGGAGGSDVKTEGFLKARAERAMTCGPENCALLIRHVEALTADRMVTALKEVLSESRVLIATTTEIDKIPDGVRSLFTHEMEISAPDEWEREVILRSIVEDQGVALAADVDLGAVAIKTAALVAGDLLDVVDRALVARQTRIEELATKSFSSESPTTIRDVQIAGGPSGRCLVKADFDIAVDAARKNFADAIGAPKIPNVSWDDVGGLTHVKDAVMETIQLPLERPELFAKGMKKRSGILFYGPPGTGKTLLAKAIATEFSLNFFSVKGPELLNMYIGESEANVRRVFQRARDARPCVVFFDELDSVAPKRGNQGDSGGVMDRIVSQLLAELDGMSDGEDGGGGVFVIGATNRPDLLDAALLRPGRFDKMLYLGVSDTHEKQVTIMEALTRKFTISPALSLTRIASTLPFTYTGADFYALCSDAMLKAVTRQAAAVDAKIASLNQSSTSNNNNNNNEKRKITTAYFFDHYATKEDIAVLVTEEDFLAAQQELVPSVSAKELEHYRRVREQFEGSATTTTTNSSSSFSSQAAAAAVAIGGNPNININGMSTQPLPGIPQWQTQLPHRTRPGSDRANTTSTVNTNTANTNGKLREKLPSSSTSTTARAGAGGGLKSKSKGKGKARADDDYFDDDDDEDDEDEVLGSGRPGYGYHHQQHHHHHQRSAQQQQQQQQQRSFPSNGFQDGDVGDDEDLY